eukprot:GEMP01019305.1.p1 GENE.GEMP01019305.1~~GEMP01019305.1.p1  ORF type:complete len:625 (+),score=164.19 GEMP01019305.1:67-1941(+)
MDPEPGADGDAPTDATLPVETSAVVEEATHEVLPEADEVAPEVPPEADEAAPEALPEAEEAAPEVPPAVDALAEEVVPAEEPKPESAPGVPPEAAADALPEAAADALPDAAAEVDVPAEDAVSVKAPNAPAEEDLVAGAPTGSVTVDFVILPEHYGQTKVLNIQLKIKDVRIILEQELSIPEGSLFLMNMTGAAEVSGILDTEKRFFEFGIADGYKVGMELRINYYQEQEVEQYVMPDVLELAIHDGTERKVVPVYVERPAQRKPYLGGYRNKQNNVEYHHAITQTPIFKAEDKGYKYHRETQTVDVRSRGSQCPRDVGTQMEKPGLYMSTATDVIFTPNAMYFSSADLFALRLEMAIIIQCHTRGMFARKHARQLKKEQELRFAKEIEEFQRDKLEDELRHKREIERRIHPRTYQDFEILRTELEAWRINETNRIQSSNFDKEMKQTALKQLLQKETKLLQTIDKLRNQARYHNRDQKIKKRLETMAEPKVWAQQDLETTTVQTPFTTRAKELMDLYNGLRVPLLTVDERLDVLLHVKWTAKEFDCNLTRDIVDLVDREADMLNRGRPETAFKGLRRRLANLFLQFVETPEFNPEAQRFQKVPRDLYQQTCVQPLSTVPIKSA